MLVHRYWHNAFHPDAEGIHWNDDLLPYRVVKWLDERAGTDRPIHHRANMVRWWLLATYGGVWCDYDTELPSEFPRLPFAVRGKTHEGPCVRLMGFTQNHPIPKLAVATLDTRPIVGDSVTVSGDGLFRLCIHHTGIEVNICQ